MKKALAMGLVSLASVSIFLGVHALEHGSQGSSGSPSVDELEKTYTLHSWIYYPNFRALLENHQVAVVGKVVERKLGAPCPHDPETQYEVRVLGKIKGPEVVKGETLTVSQTAGLWVPKGKEPVLTEPRECPLLEVGETSILFISDHENNGVYGGLSPCTRFLVIDGKVFTINKILPENREALIPKKLWISGAKLESLVSKLKNQEYPIIRR